MYCTLCYLVFVRKRTRRSNERRTNTFIGVIVKSHVLYKSCPHGPETSLFDRTKLESDKFKSIARSTIIFFIGSAYVRVRVYGFGRERSILKTVDRYRSRMRNCSRRPSSFSKKENIEYSMTLDSGSRRLLTENHVPKPKR